MKARRWVFIAALIVVNVLATVGFIHLRDWRRPSSAAAASVSTPIASPQPDPTPSSQPTATRYVGVAIHHPFTQSLDSFTRALGRPPGIVQYYMGFGTKFPISRVKALSRQHSLSLIQINPRQVSLAGIAAGTWDQYLRSYAVAVRRSGVPVALSFGHEMNGWWYSWGQPRTKADTFVAAWRHIHDVFAAAHASNVIWVWTISRVNHPGWAQARGFWPGASYVDWVGIDGYYRKPGETFDSLFARPLAAIRRFTSKPVLLTETGVSARPGRNVQIRDLFAGIQRDHLLGFVWFDINATQDWNIDQDTAAVAVLRRLTNQFLSAAVSPSAAPAAGGPTPAATGSGR